MLSLFILSCASVNFPFVCFHLHRRSWVGTSKTSIPVSALLNHTQYSAYCIWHKIVWDTFYSTFSESSNHCLEFCLNCHLWNEWALTFNISIYLLRAALSGYVIMLQLSVNRPGKIWKVCFWCCTLAFSQRFFGLDLSDFNYVYPL